MNSPPFIHSFWTNSNCRSMSAWMNRLTRPRSTPSSSSAPSARCGPYSTPRRISRCRLHRGRALERRRPRVAAAQVRAERAPQALVVARVGEVVAPMRVRRDRGIVLVGRQVDRAPAPPAAHHLGRDQLLVMRVVGAVERLRGRRQVAAKRRHVLVELAEDHVRPVQPQLERLGRLRTVRAGLVLVAQQELARLERAPGAVRPPARRRRDTSARPRPRSAAARSDRRSRNARPRSRSRSRAPAPSCPGRTGSRPRRWPPSRRG